MCESVNEQSGGPCDRDKQNQIRVIATAIDPQKSKAGQQTQSGGLVASLFERVPTGE